MSIGVKHKVKMRNNTPKLRFKEFTDEWQEKKLGDVSFFSNERIIANELNKSNFVGVDSLGSNMSGKLDSSHVPQKGKVTRYVCGDILHSNIRPYLKKAWLANQIGGSSADVLVIKPSQGVISKFLYSITTSDSYFDYVMSGAKGVKMPRGDKVHVMNYAVSVPSLPEQEKIAGFLTAVDEKINKLEDKKKGFEKYKKGVMQAIFCQEIRFKPDLSSEASAKLDGSNYPDWEEKKLGEICKITTGKLDANAMVSSGEYRFYTCAKDFYKIDKFAFDTEALLVSGNGANVGYIHYFKGKFNAYQRTYVLDKFSENIFYIKYALQKDLNQRIQVEKKEGNTPYIVLGTLTEMKIMSPSKEEQEKIAEFLTLLDNKVELIGKELEQAKLFKKALLQQMFV